MALSGSPESSGEPVFFDFLKKICPFLDGLFRSRRIPFDQCGSRKFFRKEKQAVRALDKFPAFRSEFIQFCFKLLCDFFISPGGNRYRRCYCCDLIFISSQRILLSAVNPSAGVQILNRDSAALTLQNRIRRGILPFSGYPRIFTQGAFHVYRLLRSDHRLSLGHPLQQ